jgi:predicted RNA polymerase sigma factor
MIPASASASASPGARRAAARHAVYLLYREAAGTRDPSRAGRGGGRAEAIDLARAVHRADPRDSENAGLLALLLLKEAARSGCPPEAARQQAAEAVAVLDTVAGCRPVGPFRLQAQLDAVRHAERPGPTDETRDGMTVVSFADHDDGSQGASVMG